MNIYPNGKPTSPIWYVTEYPYPQDTQKGFMFSDSFGWHFAKIIKEAGLPEPYITCLKDDPNATYDDNTVVQEFICNNRLDGISVSPNPQPPIIVPLGERACYLFCPATAKRTQAKSVKREASLDKYAGSLLTCSSIKYPHYIIPTYPPDFVCMNWDYRDVQIFIDLGHVKDEYAYWMLNGRLNPLPSRELITEPTWEQAMQFLDQEVRICPLTSVDIETIRPKKGSPFFREKKTGFAHPGYPYTISFAVSTLRAMSIAFWDYTPSQTVELFLLMNEVFKTVPQVGQNYFNFDCHHLEAMGFEINLALCKDTLLRHHILWPELPHKLQFLTRQYSRQPYYKDEGKQWSPKYKHLLMRYNNLDTTVTLEVYNGQEEEFKERPHLR